MASVLAQIQLLRPMVDRQAGELYDRGCADGFGAGSNAAIRGFNPQVRLNAIDYTGYVGEVRSRFPFPSPSGGDRLVG
jgi:hypothetical protein